MSLFVAALAPVVAIIIFIYSKDLYDKEPKRLLVASFFLGAIVSILITTILYVFTDFVLPIGDEQSVFLQFVKAFLVVGLIEEFSKYLMVRYFAQPLKAFNEPYDGIIYAVMISMGFAATENIFYVIEGGLPTALVRSFTAVPAHATFGVLMGYFMGKAKFSGNRVKYNLIGLGLAILFHGAYDFFLFINFIPGMAIGAFISLIVAIVLSLRAIKLHQKNSNFRTS